MRRKYLGSSYQRTEVGAMRYRIIIEVETDHTLLVLKAKIKQWLADAWWLSIGKHGSFRIERTPTEK